MCLLHLGLLGRGYLIEGAYSQQNMASYELFIERVKDIHKIGAIQGHLGWDQETIMPAKGGQARSKLCHGWPRNSTLELLMHHLRK